MNVLDKDCLLQLVIDNFQEDVAKSVDFNTGEVGIKYTCLEHNLNFCMDLSVVEKIYSTR
ncbi:conserved hypothetical protein [Vibrio coralliirubri]|nr:hypothetical protein A6D97_19490 [Vibrio sp. ZF57]OEF02945.1 hypothetical protein A136_10065 [Vibrio crassostreae 9ZC13]CDT02413.1 conserved hypothetical protein [Vibrio coralliirubri]CDT60228.1 conserved hypothetical protein [Vibrio coralliirubri]CDT69879.1 conserved hypothetical protein [Vibrio coralliirubri]